MKRRWHRLVGIVAGLLTLGGLMGGSVVFAQNPQDDPLRCGGATWQGPGFIEVAAQELGMGTGALMEKLRDGELLSDMAAEKGQTLDGLTEAFLAAQEEALADAVDQGYFTQERAACRLQALRQRVERCLAGLGWHRTPWGRVELDTAAEMLGMTVQEFRHELHQGKTIAGLAQSHGVALGSISESLQQAREEVLAKAVEEGRITQGQADGVHRRIQRRTELCLMWSGSGPCAACPGPKR